MPTTTGPVQQHCPESIGEVYTRLLEHHGIAAVWPTDEGWTGSPTALAAGLA
ncbi:hypothetical protein ACWGQU_06270 [[Kitasatospora] papulosa]